MIGKILLIFLVLLFAALLILLLIPVSLRISYDSGDLRVTVRYASKLLYPSERKKTKDASAQKKGKAKTQPAKTDESTKASEKKKPNFDQISYSLDVLPGIIVRALRGTMRRIRIIPLKLHILVALSDPADTAVLYGKLHGALNATLPLIHRAVRIKEQDIQLFPDFAGEKMDCIADVGIQIRPFDVLIVVLVAAFGILKWYNGYKKRADKNDTAQETTKKTTAQADPAA